MIDIMSFALGMILGAIGMVAEGYVFLGITEKNRKIYENQIRRRSDAIIAKDRKLSDLEKEIGYIRKRNERLKEELERMKHDDNNGKRCDH